jgi:phosphonopyruvate decarboxylase
MIDPQCFINVMRQKGLSFFTGVPDSYLKNLSACLCSVKPPERHITAANEGNAVGLAIGHYLASGQPAVVYMQNSGLGNTINPLTSLADREVYSVPMLLVIGWRGEPGFKDEPQHIKQGRVTPGLLELLEIPFRVIGPESEIEDELAGLWPLMLSGKRPVAILVRDKTFSKYPDAAPGQMNRSSSLLRENALETILNHLRPADCLVATTGKAGRELFELRIKRGETPTDFLTVGGMGHASSIALGAALGRPEKRFICLDGDGALLMHFGAMGVIGSLRPQNFLHILLNNYCHESVGGQPTCSSALNFGSISIACGYASYSFAATEHELIAAMKNTDELPGPHFLELGLAPGSRADLGRPTTTPRQNLDQFMVQLKAR